MRIGSPMFQKSINKSPMIQFGQQTDPKQVQKDEAVSHLSDYLRPKGLLDPEQVKVEVDGQGRVAVYIKDDLELQGRVEQAVLKHGRVYGDRRNMQWDNDSDIKITIPIHPGAWLPPGPTLVRQHDTDGLQTLGPTPISGIVQPGGVVDGEDGPELVRQT